MTLLFVRYVQDFTGGIDDDGSDTAVERPISVQRAESILVDDMPPLSSVALGPTGIAVSHSYDAALSKLLPVGEF